MCKVYLQVCLKPKKNMGFEPDSLAPAVEN
jgi:hypothetical protein